MTKATEQTEELLRVWDVAKMLGIKPPTVWKWARLGKIPKPIKISYRVTAWKKSELLPFIESLQAA